MQCRCNADAGALARQEASLGRAGGGAICLPLPLPITGPSYTAAWESRKDSPESSTNLQRAPLHDYSREEEENLADATIK